MSVLGPPAVPRAIGATLSIVLALVFDGAIYLVGRMVTPWAQRGRGA